MIDIRWHTEVIDILIRRNPWATIADFVDLIESITPKIYSKEEYEKLIDKLEKIERNRPV